MLALLNAGTLGFFVSAVAVGGVVGLVYQMRCLCTHVRECEAQMRELTLLLHAHLAHAKMDQASLEMQRLYLSGQGSSEKTPDFS